MKKTLTLLVASTALTAAIGVPAWSAMQSPPGVLRPVAALFAHHRVRVVARDAGRPTGS